MPTEAVRKNSWSSSLIGRATALISDIGESAHVAGARDLMEQDGELVAGKPRDRVGDARLRLQPAADDGEQRIA